MVSSPRACSGAQYAGVPIGPERTDAAPSLPDLLDYPFRRMGATETVDLFMELINEASPLAEEPALEPGALWALREAFETLARMRAEGSITAIGATMRNAGSGPWSNSRMRS